MKKLTKQKLDVEWIELILDALEMGLKPEDIKGYFQSIANTNTQKVIEDDCRFGINHLFEGHSVSKNIKCGNQ